MGYNASVENRIYGLIEKAHENPDKAVEFLQQAQEALSQEFVYHDIDSPEQNVKRISTKLEIYGKIIDSYDKLLRRTNVIIPKVPDDLKEKLGLKKDDYVKLIAELRTHIELVDDLRKDKENLQSNCDAIDKERDDLIKKASELEIKISEFEKSQKDLENI
jgi:DNA repair exonuclease SbcCD ATPase subunit